jgi:hypothetical protein
MLFAKLFSWRILTWCPVMPSKPKWWTYPGNLFFLSSTLTKPHHPHTTHNSPSSPVFISMATVNSSTLYETISCFPFDTRSVGVDTLTTNREVLFSTSLEFRREHWTPRLLGGMLGCPLWTFNSCWISPLDIRTLGILKKCNVQIHQEKFEAAVTSRAVGVAVRMTLTHSLSDQHPFVR